MNINSKQLDKISILYIIFPFVLFLVGFLNIPTMLISCSALFIIVKHYFKTIKNNKITFEKTLFYIIIFLCLIWCYSSGIGGFVFQNNDWHMRNAILRDLINYSYPVFYEDNTSLVYYFSLFLPSALAGKIALFFNATKEQAFQIANVVNYIYCSIGLCLIFLQSANYLKVQKLKHFWVFLVIILFSGIDIVYPYDKLALWHIEWHLGYQYSSNTTQLFWVYNQAIISWLLTLLFIKNYKKVQNYGFYAMLAFFNAPFPFVGLSIFFAIIATYNLAIRFKTKYIKNYFKKIFSIQNIISVLILMPIIYLYYKSNDTANAEKIHFCWYRLGYLIYHKFFILEAGLYLLLIYKKYKNNLMYNVIFLMLAIIPLFSLRYQPDFLMRTSIPPLFLLMLFVNKFLLDKTQLKIIKSCLILVLCIGAVTPVCEIARTIYFTNILSKEFYKRDSIKTLNNITSNSISMKIVFMDDPFTTTGNFDNYKAKNAKDKLFFKYLARKNKK